MIRLQARKQDVAARWGGDEFALLLVGASLDDAVAIAERIRGAIAGIDTDAFAPGLRVSASIGVSFRAPSAGRRSLRTLVPRADEALFRAKREGRDRVRAAVSPEPVG